MAFAEVGSLGTSNSKTSSTTLTVTLTGDADVGDLVVVMFAWDNNNNSTVTGPTDDQIECSDDQGNDWTQLGSAQAQSTANRTHGGIYFTKVTNALTAGDVITLTHRASSRVAKAATVHRFTTTDGHHWALVDQVHVHNQATDPSAITLSGIPSGYEVLLLHCLACEGPDTDTYTWDGDYTEIAGDGTTGDVDTSNMHVRGSFRIASGITSDTVDVASDTADRDYTQILGGLVEWPVDSSFPFSVLLDDFNRADEDPLDYAGQWENGAEGAEGTNNNCRLVSNQAAGESGATTNSGQRWLEEFPPVQEAWVTWAVLPTIANWIKPKIHHTGSGIPSVSTDIAVAAEWTWDTNRSHRVSLVNVGGDTGHAIVTTYIDPTAGDKLGIRWEENIYSVWIDRGAGWEIISARYSTPRNSGFSRIALGIRGTQIRCDDFGGGGPWTPDIIRRLRFVHSA